VHPRASLAAEAVVYARSRLLGLQLIDARLRAADATAPPAVPEESASQEARECIHAYRALLARAVALAACGLTLRRLLREYVRTERRTRAIENILLPEIDAAVRLLEEQLDGMDQEEFARLRQQREGRGRVAGASMTAEPAS
jgi:V/A-type H+-transporting ATPase subunit D